ncbi:MAG: FHA domain-containing protein [Gammaproteobacteria bacterium]|nr:FHA domain-containing protein [Gammaproteobacteria bacterium]
MANENKNIKELVSDDDDPTAEFEIPSFQSPVDDEGVVADLESDSHTCGLRDADDADLLSAQSIPELQSDLKSRTRTIGQLQYDIQQLRSKWLGLEAEISAREEIVSNLLNENGELTKKIARKEKLLKKRSASIKALKSEIRQREEDRALLEEQLATQAETDEENTQSRETAVRELEDARGEIETAETALADAEKQLQQREQAYEKLEQQLNEQQAISTEQSAALEVAQVEIETAQTALADAEKQLQQREQAYEKLEQRLDEEQALGAEQGAALEDARGELEAVNTALADTEKRLEQRDRAYDQLEQQLDEQRTISAEQAAALENAQRELEGTRKELHAATVEEHTLNKEINERDLIESTLEQEIVALKEQVGSLNSTEAELAADLHDARQEAAQLRLELETTLRQTTAEIAQTKKTTSSVVKEMQAKLAKTEQYADSLRFKLEDSNNVLADAGTESDNLRKEVASLAAKNAQLGAELDSARAANEEFLVSMEQLAADHEQELRTLRFELTEAQDSIAQTGDINTQLASDLVSARSFKEELERMLLRTEEEAQERISDLEKKVQQLSGTAEEYEQKLDTKNTAINVLLVELTKKSEQLESISEIEEVIQEIDDRMSERFDEHETNAAEQHDSTPVAADRDRTTRVLVGNIGEQELRFPLFKNRLTIGRTADNDIQLNASYISRRHAVVLTEGDATRVIDWGSKNGVYVNTERVKERFLSNGDIVAIGNAKFRYEERPKRDS